VPQWRLCLAETVKEASPGRVMARSHSSPGEFFAGFKAHNATKAVPSTPVIAAVLPQTRWLRHLSYAASPGVRVQGLLARPDLARNCIDR
jgi:hypothetical protein